MAQPLGQQEAGRGAGRVGLARGGHLPRHGAEELAGRGVVQGLGRARQRQGRRLGLGHGQKQVLFVAEVPVDQPRGDAGCVC